MEGSLAVDPALCVWPRHVHALLPSSLQLRLLWVWCVCHFVQLVQALRAVRMWCVLLTVCRCRCCQQLGAGVC